MVRNKFEIYIKIQVTPKYLTHWGISQYNK